jgi:protein tyrosine kinase modulator
MLGHRQLSLAEFLRICRRRWTWALAPVLFGAAAGLLLARLVPPRFVSSATVREVVERSPDLALSPPGFSASRLSALQQHALTPARVEALIARFGLYSSPGNRISGPQAISRLEKDLVVSPAPAGFTLSFTAGDAATAQKVCTEFVSLFRAEELKNLHREAGNEGAVGSANPGAAAPDFLAQQVDEAKHNLNEREAKLSEFRRQHASELSGSGSRQTEARIADYEAQLQDADAALKRALQQRAVLTDALFAQKSPALDTRKPAEPQATGALEQELAADQAQLVTLESRYTEDYPDVVKLKSDIAQLQKKIAEARKPSSGTAPGKPAAPGSAASHESAGIQDQIRDLDAQVQQKTREQARLQQALLEARARLDTRPLLSQEYKDLTADAASARALYSGLLDKQNQAIKAAQAGAGSLSVVDPPNLPARPAYPDPALFTLSGAGAGLAVGLLTIVAGEMNDKSLRNESDVQHFLDLPTLAVIPPAGAGGAVSGDAGPRAGRTGSRGEKQEGVLADV